MKYSPDLPREERIHFIQCSCGEYFDMRDLSAVMRHLHLSIPAHVEYDFSRRMGDQTLYTRSGKKLDLN